MKASLLRFGAVALLAAGTLGAQIHPSLLQDDQPQRKATPLTINTDLFPAGTSTSVDLNLKAGPSTQAITWTNMWNARFGPYFEFYTRNPVFTYDAGTNSLNIVRATGEGTTTLSGVVQVVSSMDGGSTWAATEVFRRSGYLLLIPGLAIANQGVSSLDDAYWTIFGNSYEFDGSSYPNTGTVGLFKTSGDPFDFPLAGPDINNGAGYEWSQGQLIGVNGDAAAIHHVSRLSPPTNVQYGAYGQWGFDPSFEDFTASSIPSQWDLSLFANPNNITSTLNSSPSLAADEEGRLYMVVNNLFADDDQNRVPAVSKSEDQGSTWSSFERMPVNLLEGYRTQYSWDNISVYGPYNLDGFVVTGINKFSFFFRVSQRDANNNTINLDLVEARYNAGAWTLTRIAELNGFPVQFNRAAEPSDGIGPAAWLAEYSGGDYGHEIHAALTADGQSILVQWIDDAPERGWTVFDPPYKVYFNQTSGWVDFDLDSMLTTDIYFSYRSLDGSWTEKVNITNDDAYNHGTHLPRVIPSLTNVPVLQLRPGSFDTYNQQYALLPALKALPPIIYDATIDNGTVCTLQFGTYNALNPSSVQNEQEHFSFSLNTVAPNPAQNEAEVTFSLEVPGTVSLELYATTGNKIATVYNGQLNAGVHGLTVDASAYASGTYYVALTVNGQRLTQPLAIVK